MGWSDEDFRARIAQRCTELGCSKRSVLKAAALAHDYLQTEPQHGRRIDNLAKLAVALNWSLGELLGLKAVSVDEATMLRAYRSMKRVVRRTRRAAVIDDEVEVWVLSTIYNMYDEAREEYADSNTGYEEYASHVESTVYMALTNPRFAASVQRKIQRFQQSGRSTAATQAAAGETNSGPTDLPNHPLPDKV